MGNKYKKIKFSLKKELLIIVGIIVVLAVATILLTIPSKQDKFIEKWQDAGSSYISEDYYDLFKETSLSNLDSVITDNDQVVVLYASVDSEGAELMDHIIEYKEQFKDQLTKQLTRVYIVYASEDDDTEALDAKYSLDETASPTIWVFENHSLACAYELQKDLAHEEQVKQLMLYVLQ